MPGHIVVVGSLNMDLVVRVAHHPQVGETILADDFHTFPGGKGANQAVAAARLGGQVQMVGRVGVDGYGDSLLQTLARDGVDTQRILRTPDAPTGIALIPVDARGQNIIIVVSGANARVTPADVLAAEEVIAGAGILLVQLETPLDAVTQAVELAHKRGVRVVLNPAPAQPLAPSLLARIDYMIPNQSELALLTGLESPRAAIRRLQGWGVERIILTLGEDGVLVVDGEKEIHLPAHRVNVVDTTAAGDAFVGAFAVALIEGRSLVDAAAWANSAGALAVTRAGAQPSLPTRGEVEKMTC